jgi:chitodextrinase
MNYHDYSYVSELSRMAGLFALVIIAATSEAALCTTRVNAPTATESWADAIWQPGPAAPIPGNSYEILRGGLLQSPSGGSSIFHGDSLMVDRGARLRLKGTSPVTLGFPGVDGNAGLVLNGGRLQIADDNVFTVDGQIVLAADSLVDLGRGSRSLVITAQLSGEGDLTVRGSLDNSLDVQSANNPYTGNWRVVRSYLRGVGDGSLGAGDITVSHGTLEINYDIQTPGSLTLLGADSVMVLHQNCQFSAVTINGAELEPGTYSYAELAAQFPGTFAEGGTGSITVTAPISDSETDPLGRGTSVKTVDLPATDDLAPAKLKVKINAAAPAAPVGLSMSVDSSSQITLTWTRTVNFTVPAAMAYQVYRGKILVGATSGTSFTDTGLAGGARYCYKIVAFDDAGNYSLASRRLCARTPRQVPPTAPSNLAAVGVTASSITLQWQDNSSNETAFKVERATKATGPWTMVGLIESNAVSFTDGTVEQSTAYFYRVSALN